MFVFSVNFIRGEIKSKLSEIKQHLQTRSSMIFISHLMKCQGPKRRIEESIQKRAFC
jgi:hypothetical protein